MTDPNHPENSDSIPDISTADVETETSNPTDPSEQTSAEQTDSAPQPPADPLQQALEEAAKWKDLAYRSQAELDNYRKRATKEAQEARSYANSELLRAILPILDNFEMGLSAAKAESESSMIFLGMQMVHRQFQEWLKDSSVQEIEAQDLPFDPNLHDAVAQEPSSTHPEGTILRVTRRGYKLKDRLLRPASVICACPPTEDTASAPAEDQSAAPSTNA